MFDMTESIAPKSDQLNAEDLLSGPRTVTVTEVRRGSDEQPVEIVTAEFGPGRPFKPSKTVRRILVVAWGRDASTYAGRRMTLYRDPEVRFGGQDVGGIRVSHLSHIDKPMKLALTITRGKRAPYMVQRLVDAPVDDGAITADQLTALNTLMESLARTSREEKLAYLTEALGREITSSRDVTREEADELIEANK